MTVDKVTKQGNHAAKQSSTASSSNTASEAPAGSPTQLKPAAETSTPISPKKPESKNGSPVNKASVGLSASAQQVPPKNSPKKNPWNMNPPSSSSSSSSGSSGPAKPPEGKKSQGSTVSTTKGGNNWTISSKHDTPGMSKSIRIPRNEVLHTSVLLSMCMC